MISEISQAQEDEGPTFSLIHGRQIEKYTYTQKQTWSHTISCI
jgi:hypothetical protein